MNQILVIYVDIVRGYPPVFSRLISRGSTTCASNRHPYSLADRITSAQSLDFPAYRQIFYSELVFRPTITCGKLAIHALRFGLVHPQFSRWISSVTRESIH